MLIKGINSLEDITYQKLPQKEMESRNDSIYIKMFKSLIEKLPT